jgi:predicted aldo/keto reductase-like oxidoreductase
LEKIRLGKTGMMVTRIGFGGIPIQRISEDEAVKIVQRCIDLGINFFDTANSYTVSEGYIGKAIKGRRDDVFIATKTGAREADEIEKHLELSLQRLDTDYIDLYQFHGVSDQAALDKILAPENGLYEVFEKAKKTGKIRHIGITSHQIDVAKKQVESGFFETMMFPFNFISREPGEELLHLCKEHDVGFINMKPIAGGMLNNVTIAFKYLFQFSDMVIIPGIEKIREIDEIISIYNDPHEMSAEENAEMERMREELGTRFCRRCDYCQPCQQEIPISMLMTFPSMVKRMPSDWYLNNPRISEMMEKVVTCIDCGECEERCPYDLSIREMIKESYDLYESVKAGV